MKLTYERDYNVESVLNQHLWVKANDFTLTEVNEAYTGIIGRLKSSSKPVYIFEKYYKQSYRCDLLKELNPNEIINSLENELIPHIKKQFIYETALFRLITEQQLIPESSGNAHSFYNAIFGNYSNGAAIQIELNGTFGNSYCYIYLEFPYYSFRISPFAIK